MNKAIIFLSGAVVGGVAGFVAAHRKYKKQLAKAEADINILLREINKPEKDSEVSDDKEGEKAEEGGTAKPVEAAGAAATKAPVKQQKDRSWAEQDYISEVSYAEFYKKTEPDPAETEHPSEDIDEDEDEDYGYRSWEYDGGYESDPGVLDTDDIYEEEGPVGKDTRKPRVISKDSYYNEYPENSKNILDYYAGDDVLIDCDNEEEIDDVYRLVGDCLDKYGFRTDDDQSILYVRNFAYGADYEISKTFESFYDTHQ